jgi:hypothetical protein
VRNFQQPLIHVSSSMRLHLGHEIKKPHLVAHVNQALVKIEVLVAYDRHPVLSYTNEFDSDV